MAIWEILLNLFNKLLSLKTLKMNISQTLHKSAQTLSNISETPIIDAEILLAFVLSKDKAFLYSYPEYKLSKDELKTYSYYIKKRLEGYSVASITGFKDFYGLEFIVNKDTLIPRPETELMVDEVLSIFKKICNKKNIALIDLGTGSGCIPISILKCTQNIDFENLQCFAIDISPKALEMAHKNAKKHGLENNISFLEGNLLKPIDNKKLRIKNYNFIITANLPYLTKKQIKNSPSIQKEPVLALDGGKNGMDYYIKLFRQVKTLKNKYSPASITILAEIDHTQIEIFKKEVARLLPFAKLKIKKDLGGYERLATLLIKN